MSFLTQDVKTVHVERQRRLARLHTRIVPEFRLLGLMAGALLCAVHNWAIYGQMWSPGLGLYAGGALAYSLLTWALLSAIYSERQGAFLSDALLWIDMLFAAGTVAVTGGAQSWLFFLPYSRVGDQLPRGVRRSSAMLGLALTAHALGVWIPHTTGFASADWRVETVKIGAMCFMWGHIILASRVSETQRLRGQATARVARRVLGELDARSAQLEGAVRDARVAAEAKSQFMASVTHELRTPMNGIIGMTELALGTDLTKPQAELIGTAQESAKRLLGLVNEILDVSQLEAGEVVIEPQPFSLRQCLDVVRNQFDGVAREKGVELRVMVAEDLPDDVLGDATRLRQILVNLCDNAVKFTDDGLVAIRADWSPADGDASVRFAVQDTGVGIASDRLDSIFDVFTQADQDADRRFGGAGVGLTISQQLCVLMGSELKVKSEIHRGSTFAFDLSLPRQIEPEARRPSRRSERAPSELEEGGSTKPRRARKKTKRPQRVLVMEDNPVNQRVVKLLLDSWGHTVLIAPDGQQGVEMLKKEQIDLTLVDLQMPVLDGLGAAREWRAHEHAHGLNRLPMAALTANCSDADRARCFDAGMDAFFSKPIDLDGLFEHIESLPCEGEPGESGESAA